MSLIVLEAGPLATIQDEGRVGLGRFGVPACGPMDWYAYRAANALVGNDPGAAVLETGLSDLVVEAADAMMIAVTGAGYELFIQDRPRPLWMSLKVKRGWTISLRKRAGGSWAYLAIGGGVKAAVVLGARATYVRGQFGGLDGRPIQAGSRIALSTPTSDWHVREVPTNVRPAYGSPAAVQVVLGPQADRFTEVGLRTFLDSAYTVSATADRMGYRLQGNPVEHSAGADIVSDGMVMGSIQVPANGQPMVMMADGPTTGGYPKIATVVTADLPLLAQTEPGAGRVRFAPTLVEAARARYLEMVARLTEALRQSEESPVIGW